MLFCVICMDRPNSLPLRQATRPAHIEYVSQRLDMVKLGGPLMDEDGTSMIGSMLILEAEDRAQAEAFVANDPYSLAGLFHSAEVHPWNHLIGSLPPV
jgi:uncharacterized protein YciI